MTCARCGTLQDTTSANTGRDQALPGDVHSFKRLWNRSGTADDDLLQCPVCGAWFEWEDEPQMYGSGNEWSEKVTRLPPKTWIALERVLHGDVGADGDELWPWLSRLKSWDRLLADAPQATFDAFIPALARHVAQYGNDGTERMLRGRVTTPEQRKVLADTLRACTARSPEALKLLSELTP